MRSSKFFCNNKSVGELLSQFPLSQGPLFHYTGQAASIGIRGGEIWMTRADCFLDQSEIAHGLKVFYEAARTTLCGEEIESFSKVLKALRVRLQACFVLSLSQDPNSDHLRSVYAKENGAILEFQENFPNMFYDASWHTIPNSDDSWSDHRIADLYEFFEGFVVYDGTRQLQLAKMACQSYRDLQCTNAHFVDRHHFIDILIRCMVLFKTPKFEVEKEYRLSLIRGQQGIQPFEETRDCAGKRRAYVKVRILSSDTPKIRARAEELKESKGLGSN